MNNLIIKYKNEDINEDECFNSNQNECMACIDNNNLILINNNFCSCFKYIVFCERCFISWLLNNPKCIICREKFQDENSSIFDIFDILNIKIYKKILLKLEDFGNNHLSSSRLPHNQNNQNSQNSQNNQNNQNNQNRISKYYIDFDNAYAYYSFAFICIYMCFIGTFTTIHYIYYNI